MYIRPSEGLGVNKYKIKNIKNRIYKIRTHWSACECTYDDSLPSFGLVSVLAGVCHSAVDDWFSLFLYHIQSSWCRNHFSCWFSENTQKNLYYETHWRAKLKDKCKIPYHTWNAQRLMDKHRLNKTSKSWTIYFKVLYISFSLFCHSCHHFTCKWHTCKAL